MRVAVTRTQVPFVSGGAERHSQQLCKALRQYGHEATEVTIPFKWYPIGTLVENIAAAKLLDLSEAEGVADRPHDRPQVSRRIWFSTPILCSGSCTSIGRPMTCGRTGRRTCCISPTDWAAKQMIEAEDRGRPLPARPLPSSPTR